MKPRRVLRWIPGLTAIVLLATACAGATEVPPAATAAVPPAETRPAPSPTAEPADLETVQRVAEEITWLRSTNPYGHTAIKLESEGKAIYVDPVDLVGLENLPKADWLLITHDHGDHFSIRDITALSKAGTVAVSIPTMKYTLSGLNFFELTPGAKADAGGLQVQGVAAYNDSHAKEMGYLGFIFTLQGVRIYCSGDTGMTPELEALSGIDIAVLNVRKPYTFSGEEAVRFARTVKPKILIPIHWMPDDDTYGDAEEIEYIRENIPETTVFMVLKLTPAQP